LPQARNFAQFLRKIACFSCIIQHFSQKSAYFAPFFVHFVGALTFG
jgi:hypothetical protein